MDSDDERVAREDIEAEVDALRAAMDGDVDELHRRLAAMASSTRDEEITAQASSSTSRLDRCTSRTGSHGGPGAGVQR